MILHMDLDFLDNGLGLDFSDVGHGHGLGLVFSDTAHGPGFSW